MMGKAPFEYGGRALGIPVRKQVVAKVERHCSGIGNFLHAVVPLLPENKFRNDRFCLGMAEYAREAFPFPGLQCIYPYGRIAFRGNGKVTVLFSRIPGPAGCPGYLYFGVVVLRFGNKRGEAVNFTRYL
jgi:hypothetical protein